LAAAHEFSDGRSDLAERHRLTQQLVKMLPWTTQFLWSEPDPSEQVKNFRSPKEVRQHDRINVRIHPSRSDRLQLYPATSALHHLNHAAPLWNTGYDLRQMSVSCNDSHLLKRLSINVDLTA